MRYSICFSILLFLAGSFVASAQQKERQKESEEDSTRAIQLSGVVVTNDSLPRFIPYAHVYVKERKQGAISNAEGFFSLAVMPGDTVRFRSMGFKDEKLRIPDSLKKDGYLVRVEMVPDTTRLDEIVLYPWPSRENFKQEFLNMRVPTTEKDLAERNLAVQALRDRAEAMGFTQAEIQRYAIRAHEYDIYNQNRYYGDNAGTAILGALSNPFAWAKFFESLKKK